jgi:hypothetical protein
MCCIVDDQMPFNIIQKTFWLVSDIQRKLGLKPEEIIIVGLLFEICPLGGIVKPELETFGFCQLSLVKRGNRGFLCIGI